MQKQLEPPVVLSDGVARNGKRNPGECEGKGSVGPIRKQSLEERRAYMRAYRLQHPGLSTPYVRKYREHKPPEST